MLDEVEPGNPGINPGSTLGAMWRTPEKWKVVAMTTTEYLLNLALVGLVLLQIRGLKVTKAALVFVGYGVVAPE